MLKLESNCSSCIGWSSENTRPYVLFQLPYCYLQNRDGLFSPVFIINLVCQFATTIPKYYFKHMCWKLNQ
jgi:hypothetical protein